HVISVGPPSTWQPAVSQWVVSCSVRTSVVAWHPARRQLPGTGLPKRSISVARCLVDAWEWRALPAWRVGASVGERLHGRREGRALPASEVPSVVAEPPHVISVGPPSTWQPAVSQWVVSCSVRTSVVAWHPARRQLPGTGLPKRSISVARCLVDAWEWRALPA